MCLYPADKTGLFDGLALSNVVGIGETLGSQGAITVAGVLLATILLTAETASVGARAIHSAKAVTFSTDGEFI